MFSVPIIVWYAILLALRAAWQRQSISNNFDFFLLIENTSIHLINVELKAWF